MEGRPPGRGGRAEGSVFVGLLKVVPSDGRALVVGGGGGPIDEGPLILNRDFALEFDVRAVVVGVVVRGEDCPELLS
jgi:hypothetical protein